MDIEFDLKQTYNNCRLALQKQSRELMAVEWDNEIKKRKLTEIYRILSNNDLKLLCEKITKNEYLNKFTYEDLCELDSSFSLFAKNVKELKASIDMDSFALSGEYINIPKLKQKYKDLGGAEKFPNFDFKRLKELFISPPKTLIPLDYHTTQEILVDDFVFRKYLFAILQMVINEMDLLVLFTGAEGSGKSSACSQDMCIVYYILKELKLITYAYDIKNMWFGNLNDFLDAEDRYFKEKFRILGLDEGNELNRQDWQQDTVKTFFQRLRRERYNQRIKFICIPQIAELLKSIVLSRANFIFSMDTLSDIETGTLEKGFCDMHIIPRGEKIYSPAHKKELSKDKIVNLIGKLLDDKAQHLKRLPGEIKVKRFVRNNVWGFNKQRYEKHLKDANRTFSITKGVRLTEYQAFCYFRSRPPLKEWSVDNKKDKEIYATLVKMDRSICKIFETDPKKSEKYERLITKNRARKALEQGQ